MFNIKDIEVEAVIKKAILDAEKEGLTEFEITKSDRHFMYVQQGQILQYKPESKKDIPLKYTYEVVESEYDKIKVRRVEYAISKQVFIDDDKLKQMLAEYPYGKLEVGKMLINSEGDYGKIISITVQEGRDNDLTYNTLLNPHQIEIKKDLVFIKYAYESEQRITDNKFDHETQQELSEFTKKSWYVIDDFNKFSLRVEDVEATKTLQQYGQFLLGDNSVHDNPEKEMKALIRFSTKETLTNMADDMNAKKQELTILNFGMKRVIQLKKEEADRMLEMKKEELAIVMMQINHSLSIFKSQIKKIHMLIDTLEIYYGVNENIIQIAEGTPADESTPINLRQMKLYMDEEFGDTTNGGLDFETIEKFDEWLIDSGNYTNIVPEEKCIVIMQPRRKNKDRGDLHPILKVQKEALDRMMYVIIRNGQNIYRIWTDNIDFGARLFPKKDEFQEIVNEIIKAKEKRNDAIEQDSKYYMEQAEKEIIDKESNLFSYKRNILLIQGVIWRTDIFKPLPADLDLMKPETYNGHINFIYDEENTLEDGRLRYNEWLTEINKSICKGSRVFLVRPKGHPKDWDKRFLRYYNEYSFPPLPNNGVYQVHEYAYTDSKRCTKNVTVKEIKEDRENDKLSKLNNGDYKKKYDCSYCVSGRDDDEILNVYLYDEKGSLLYEKVEIRKLKILYNPKDKVRAGWGQYFDDFEWERERKNNISFIIKNTDNFIINYDALVLDDLDYYINNRIDRHNYLHMLPVLRGLRESFKKEKEQEDHFIKMMTGEICKTMPTIYENVIYQTLADCVEWWKNTRPFVWKRPLSKNESKAFKMIKERAIIILKKKNKKSKK